MTPSTNPVRLPIRVREMVDREVELSPDDIALVRSWMADALICHVQYHDYRSSYQGDYNLAQIHFCEKFGVDPEIDSDRVEFFRAVVERIGA